MIAGGITAALAATVGHAGPEPLHVVQLGSAGATGSITLHAWVAGDRYARWVAKTARNALHGESLRREWAAVSELQRKDALRSLIPAARARFAFQGADWFVYDGAAGRTMYAHFRNRITRTRNGMLRRFAAQALGAILCVHRSAGRAAQGPELAADLCTDLEWLERRLPGFPLAVSEQVRVVAEHVGQWRSTLPLGQVHGDFSPYNVLVRSVGGTEVATIKLIDWEHAEPARPQHLDVLRFVAAGTLMGLRGAARRAALRELHGRDAVLRHALLQPWLDAATERGARYWLEPARLEALWCHFLVHAARRETERSGSTTDWTESTYVPALADFTDRAGSARATRVRSAAGAGAAWIRSGAYKPR